MVLPQNFVKITYRVKYGKSAQDLSVSLKHREIGGGKATREEILSDMIFKM